MKGRMMKGKEMREGLMKMRKMGARWRSLHL